MSLIITPEYINFNKLIKECEVEIEALQAIYDKNKEDVAELSKMTKKSNDEVKYLQLCKIDNVNIEKNIETKTRILERYKERSVIYLRQKQNILQTYKHQLQILVSKAKRFMRSTILDRDRKFRLETYVKHANNVYNDEQKCIYIMGFSELIRFCEIDLKDKKII